MESTGEKSAGMTIRAASVLNRTEIFMRDDDSILEIKVRRKDKWKY